MEKMSDLKDLLKHEVHDLYSAEQQIIKALPAMIQKANNAQLKTALEKHLQVTFTQLKRLNEVQAFFDEVQGKEAIQKKGLLARLFKRNHICRGMKGLIEEGEKVMAEEMNSEVLDAAIIACAQKIEHYEICGYSTARAFARELNLPQITQLLEQTLNEEYEADDNLTALAVGQLNQKAESASGKPELPNKIHSFQKTNVSPVREEIPESQKSKELEFVSKQTNSIESKKQTVVRNKAPKGEAERKETIRETSSVRRVAANNSNSKNARSASNRKATDDRTNAPKTKRNR